MPATCSDCVLFLTQNCKLVVEPNDSVCADFDKRVAIRSPEKKHVCGACSFQSKCGTIEHADADPGCISFKAKSSARREDNPKDMLGMKRAPVSTLSCPVLWEMGLGMLEGARKYGRHNYRDIGVRASVYYDAAMGHLMDWWEGEDIDPDSGMNHVTKAMTALATFRDSMLMGNWIDDRPPRNPNKLNKKHFNPIAKAIIEKYPNPVDPYTEANKGKERDKCGRIV